MVRTKRATGAPLFASLAQPRDAGIWHKDPATPCVAVEIQPTVAQILPIYTAWSRFLSGTPRCPQSPSPIRILPELHGISGDSTLADMLLGFSHVRMRWRGARR